MGFTTGTLDEEVLIGKKENCDGPHQGREGAETGRQLATMTAGHLWMENAIVGVTDEVKVGKKFVEGFEGLVVA